MTEIDRDDVVARLRSALGSEVRVPGTEGYSSALAAVFSPEAARRRPACVVTPRTVDDVATVLRIATAARAGVTVRGGGLSSTCVADGLVMVDLSRHLRTARTEGDQAVIGGGATMGSMMRALAPTGRAVPIGVTGYAGLGLATRGGIGPLTRSLGLTVDHLTGAEIVLPSGDIVHVSERSTGADADLWWAVRGCAPAVGVVTSAEFRTHVMEPVRIDRAVVGLDALATYFRVAPELPRHTSMSAVLGYTPMSPDEPVLFLYTVCASNREDAIGRAHAATSAVMASANGSPLYRSQTTGSYPVELPEFAIPGVGGAEPEPISPPDPRRRAQGSFLGKAVFSGTTLDPELADALADRIRAAPTRACRIDFQHTGGALSGIDDTATAFWGRTAEWSIPINAIWDNEADGTACASWAHDTLRALDAHTLGVYAVELRPGLPETDAETRAAYGGNLTRLRALRQRHDPTGTIAPQLL
ncbi:FAD-binding oxidoreductase [Nocardia sp. CDC153]|uniref:FAD-binding oxidoreductase n=1 Tax=Nocardia sp. CDC153 TaxID=3112167 RepID=UPI002DB8753F|nr:FAD-binding oxidoreductase [Nocardia sp. CDC153]MEC3958906.1 FAD-binding oxidoreductase [Nocardia sp. CDC153]